MGDYSFLSPQEKLTLDLRQLYEDSGFKKFKVAKFESYDFYAENRDFIIGSKIISFTDSNGRLMALKPDVTLSIVKNTEYNDRSTRKLYYTENVYREVRDIHELREIFQLGVEVVGAVTPAESRGVAILAVKSLDMIDPGCVLVLSHMRYLEGLLDEITPNRGMRADILSLMAGKNAHGLKAFAASEGLPDAPVSAACELCTSTDYGVETAVRCAMNGKMSSAAEELADVCEALDGAGFGGRVRIDMSLSKDPGYYDGMIFEGYVNGVSRAVLSGGRYDSLMRRMGKGSVSALGFAVYFDALERKLVSGGTR